MNMQMRHRLTRCWPVIDSDIKCIRFERRFHVRLRPIQQRQQVGLFICRQIKKGRNMPLGNHLRVACGNRKAVTDHDAVLVLVADPFGVLPVNDSTERAGAGVSL